MRTMLLICTIALVIQASAVRARDKNNPPNPASLGANISECGKGNPPLWMSGNFKSPDNRDIYRSIADTVGASKDEDQVDTAIVDEKLNNLFGSTHVACMLTLRPSGRVETVKVLDSSGDPKLDSKCIDLLKRVGQYGTDHSSQKNLSYRVELPNLRVVPQPEY